MKVILLKNYFDSNMNAGLDQRENKGRESN